jgi:hypothetical protein
MIEGHILLPQAVSKLRHMKDEFATREHVDDIAIEDFKARLLQVVAMEGGLHIGVVGENHVGLLVHNT